MVREDHWEMEGDRQVGLTPFRVNGSEELVPRTGQLRGLQEGWRVGETDSEPQLVSIL